MPHLAVGPRLDALLPVEHHLQLAEEQLGDVVAEGLEVVRRVVGAGHPVHVEAPELVLDELRVEDPVGVEAHAPHVGEDARHAPAGRQREHVHLAALEACEKAYHHVTPNVPPADPAAQTAFEKEREAFWKEAEKYFVDALELVRVRPNTAANERDDVNVKAAQILGKTRPVVTKAIIGVLETKIFKAKTYTPPTTLYDEAFKAIGLLNDHKDGWAYCCEWIKSDNQPAVVDRIKAVATGNKGFHQNVPREDVVIERAEVI